MKLFGGLIAALLVVQAVATTPNFDGVDFSKAPSPSLRKLGGSTVSSCTKSGSHATNVVVTITPENPGAGEDYTMVTSYDLDEEVTSGTATYVATLNGFPVVNQKNPLCEDLSGGDTPCPLEKGHIHSTSTGTVPSGVSGELKAQTSWTDQNGQAILCIAFDFHL